MHFLDFDIIRQPATPELTASTKGSSDLLVVFVEGEERRTFLGSILKAAGFAAFEKEVSLLGVRDASTAMDLSTLLLRESKISRVMVFGIEPKQLGIHFQLAPYVPITVNGHAYLLCDDLATIMTEKAAGKPQKAAALWRAVKIAFTH